ncbi:flavoprotein, HI0933 family [Xenococcus sp. PCC 7305]|uniref:NAD(P)/FAD-dependent oxidoreductase n=1 Tax=Xenococcus sp. PCC 7305 TaxID=102125 RepID=UPI0002ACCF1A|nr:NAD(P)/FAD-dependent oxidoreductase [Xenococcus sp. PCC 7305]ELS00873.1 flavoprotein, HI0933 family [Xenococcus sp. PCC 7305]
MVNQRDSDLIVIGGGAAGFFGAIACAANNPLAKVTILEAGSQLLAKVRISGGGRCNVTHHCFEPAKLIQNYPRGSKALRGAFSRFQPQDTVKWFESRGVKLKTEADGRMFPITDDSATIVNCLLKAAEQAGVGLRTRTVVKSVKKARDRGWQVILKNGEVLTCNSVLIATGSNPSGYRWAKQLGHNIEPPVPSLFTFGIKDSRLQGLAGVTVVDTKVKLLGTGKIKLEQTGPLLVTHWGLSAPVILKLSAWGARVLHDHKYNLPLEINLLPQYNQETLKQELTKIKSSMPKKKVITYCPFSIPKRFWQNLVNYIGIKPEKVWSELSKKELNKLVLELVQGKYQITGKGVFKEEFVTCGGVNLKEINFKTMESKICPGLYFAGEVLDIDGVTGGFNFQSAWTTGWLAGNAVN